MSTSTGVPIDHCLDLLEVPAAGITLALDDLRVPLAASDAHVRRLEQASATLGDAPGLETAVAPTLALDEAVIRRRWPLFHQVMAEATPYRSTVTIRVAAGSLQAVLDLFSPRPDRRWCPSPDRVREAAALVRRAIGTLSRSLAADEQPACPPTESNGSVAWCARRPVVDRMRVWQAIGMLEEGTGCCSSDALAMLRGFAFRTDRDLDELAAALVARRTTTVEVAGGA
ncbi:hypothetical protein FHX74_000065 [Friedmanniella endophytica]|uniref:ANTAR domain-containing protein n=1 Tax=Microlunatus kandeliicorticis TaxID=1759536 RepID=A0A7W3INS9_9ACTN|nr:hypothetical protein [Microlunatus kandeliicorticis]MBA8792471.1 hypothetical protein [Microlunatus kandeliicorticis]